MHPIFFASFRFHTAVLKKIQPAATKVGLSLLPGALTDAVITNN